MADHANMTRPPVKPSTAPRLEMLSCIAAPISWALLYVSGRVTGADFNEGASNTMVLLLWISAAVVVVGVTLAVAALRAKGTNRPLAIAGLVINAITLAIFLALGLFWIGMSI